MDRAEIVNRVKLTLGESQTEFGRRFGVSRRTMSRWAAGQTGPVDTEIAEMARLVHGRDPALATRIAEHLGQTLASLDIVSPAPVVDTPPADPVPPAVPVRPLVPTPPFAFSPTQLVDAVVCAAAEAMDVSPRAIRPALVAALTRARELHLTRDDLLAALVPPAV